jgi:uncharacterized protein Yka (UPF0111/DUF47 family)
MAAKSQMLSELGEHDLLLPTLVNLALAANDRAKYRLTLLQTARYHAVHPDAPVVDLRRERLESGVDDAALDRTVGGTRRVLEDRLEIPDFGAIHAALVADVRAMMAPFEAAGQLPGSFGATRESLAARLPALLAAAPPPDEAIPAAYIDRLTSGERQSGDSLHLLVMDLHRALDTLQADIAEESIGGAHVYGLSTDDRPLVAAFMEGVGRTAGLKFDHPGLGTTATRAGPRLVLQNDIGMTDAHLLIVHVEGNRVTVHYTDVHAERLAFFQSMQAPFAVEWSASSFHHSARLEGEGDYQLAVGTYTAADRDDLGRYLSHLGSRLVFLIDWNRARKRLRGFVKGTDAQALLAWAASAEVGHRAWLQFGGERLINEAIELAKAPIRYGEPLHEVIGQARATDFLRFVLRTCTEALRQGRSEFLVRDEIGAELMRCLVTAQQSSLELAAEHATLVGELAAAVRDALQQARAGDAAFVQRSAERARRWEHRADDLVNQARALAARRPSAEKVRDILVGADDVADDLEDAASMLTLLGPAGVDDALYEPVQRLADLLVHGAREYVKAIECARLLHRESPRADWQDFLEAVDEIMTTEHRGDDAHRAARRQLISGAPDFRQLAIFGDIAARLEEAADDLARAAWAVRNHVLGAGAPP